MFTNVVPWLMLLGGIAPQEMREIVAERLSRLDKLTVEMTSKVFVCPAASSPLETANWTPRRWGIPFVHRIKIVRPNMLDETLTDDPEKGYVPATSSVFNGGFTRRHVRPNKEGRINYSVAEGAVQLATYKVVPLLQVLDIHIQDCPIAQLNLLRLFDEHEVTLVGAVGDVSTYTATVDGDGATHHYEFDVNARGTPLRFKTVLALDGPGLQPATWQMYTLDTVEVNGAEFPTESVVTIFNPNVGPTHYGVHHFQVTCVAVDGTLTPQDVRIEPVLHDSQVHFVGADGIDEVRAYDSAGNVVRTQVFTTAGGPAEGGFVSAESLRWRWLVPAGAGVFGLVAVWALRFVSQRHVH